MSIFSINTSDLYYSIIFLGLLFALLFIIDFLYKKQAFSHFFLRKFVHIIVGVMVVLASFYLESSVPIITISVLFVLINIVSIQKKKFTSIHGEDKSYGTVYYPLAILVLAILFWDNYLVLFQITTLIMALSDAFAAIIGEKYGKTKFKLIKDNKSIAGLLAMFISTFIIIFLMLILYSDISLLQLIIIAISIGLISVAAELLSSNGSDNLTVPLLSSLFLFVFLKEYNTYIFNQLLMGIILSLALVLSSAKLKYLSISGVVATFILGSVIFGLGGVLFAIPIFAFFIISSLLSLIGKKGKRLVEKTYEKTSTRDYAQVIANGGIAGLLVIFNYFYPNTTNYIIYLSVIAASTADTWATEIGFFSKKLPRLITNFKPVAKGKSGAVSILGTVAAVAGSFIIVLIGIVSGNFYIFNINTYIYMLVVIISGTAACFFDSILGATVQAQYKCGSCNQITEKNIHCGNQSILQSGNKYIRNDAVNFFSSIFSVIVSIFIIILIYWK
jgi:uncharacterized protein (TIGR00297 family)